MTDNPTRSHFQQVLDRYADNANPIDNDLDPDAAFILVEEDISYGGEGYWFHTFDTLDAAARHHNSREGHWQAVAVYDLRTGDRYQAMQNTTFVRAECGRSDAHGEHNANTGSDWVHLLEVGGRSWCGDYNVSATVKPEKATCPECLAESNAAKAAARTRGPMPTVEYNGKVYKVRSRKTEIPDLSAMTTTAALMWLLRNTTPKGTNHRRPAPNLPNLPLTVR